MSSRWTLAALGALAVASWPAHAQGQTVRGLVAEQLSLAPAQGAVVVLLRVGAPDELTSVAVATTDSDGAFSVTAPAPGVYRLQADLDGLASPLSAEIALEGGADVGDVALMLPSPLLHLALGCQLEAAEGTAAVVGVVRDPEMGVPLPGALVTATFSEGRIMRRLEAQTGPSGRYRVCGIPADAGTVRFQTQLLGRSNRASSVDIPGPSVILHDMSLSVGATTERPKDVIQEQILQEAAAQSLGDIHGQVRDQMSATPLPYAVVRVVGTPHQTVTDEGGRFAFEGLTPGEYTLAIRSLGYAVSTDPVEVPAGKNVLLTLRVAPQAVELEGLEVTTRSAVEQTSRLTPFRMDIAFGESMAIEEARGARAYEILRRTSPGLRVTEVTREVGPPAVCIQTNRRIQSLTDVKALLGDRGSILESSLSSSQCANVQVVVDGMKVHDGPEYLLRTPASEIESMEFVSPTQAQILYGVGGDTSNGVVVIYTRGKGPYASPLRNRGPGPGSSDLQ